MSANSSIEWTDATWNFLAGCSPVSEECRNCYAAKDAVRLGGNPNELVSLKYAGTAEMRGTGERRRAVFTGKVTFTEDALLKPLAWKKPRRIFVNSMSDLFHAAVADEVIDRAFAVMALCPQHTFQVLTKRPERMAEYFAHPEREHRVRMAAGKIDDARPLHHPVTAWVPAWPLANVWLGTSVGNQAAADERIPHLLRTPATVRFLSCEPLLGAVDLTYNRFCVRMGWGPPSPPGDDLARQARWLLGPPSQHLARINWIIVGGESGPHARPMHPAWARSLRDQCAVAGVPFFFKQWGEWAPESLPTRVPAHGAQKSHRWPDSEVVFRFGKALAGRLLDGVEHNAFPEVPHA